MILLLRLINIIKPIINGMKLYGMLNYLMVKEEYYYELNYKKNSLYEYFYVNRII